MGRNGVLQFLCLTVLVTASEAEAARQGSLGAVSSGSIGISVSVAPRAQILGPKDITFGGTAGAFAQNVCLSSNSLARSFTVSAVGSGKAGAFELISGHQVIAYTVEWPRRNETTSQAELIRSASQRADSSRSDCEHGQSVTALVVAIDPAHLSEVRTGAPFTGLLTLMVTPE